MATRLTERRNPREYTPLRVACQLLGDMPWPVVLVDPELRVSQASPAALLELPRLEARIERGLLIFSSDSTGRRLRTVLEQLATRTRPAGPDSSPLRPSALPAGPRSHRECLLTDVRDRPVAWATIHAIAGTTAHAVALHVLRPSGPLDAAVLRRRLHLTPGEATVAALVLAHPRVTDLADRLGLSPNTVKNHLKSIFAKCAVRSRAEFSALLCSIGRA
jgi:DNA-binding CsgD family transcriptional regulator